MALVARIGVTARTGKLQQIEIVEIKRLARLRNPEKPDDEVHPYRVRIYAPDLSHHSAEARFEHRYGDGARKCLALALAALDGI